MYLKPYVQCVNENFDMTFYLLGKFVELSLLAMVVLGVLAILVISTNWPNQNMPDDGSDHCPVLLETDDREMTNAKITKCQEWYASQR